MQIYCFLFLLALSAVKGNNELQCPPPLSSIQALLDKARMHGAALLVVNRTGIVYNQAFGYQAPPISGDRQPVDTANSIFLLASISKTFVAVAAMQLVESNRLNLDTNINEYLSPVLNVVHPQYPNVPITTRHLLSHLSSIGASMTEELAIIYPGDDFTKYDLADALRKYLRNNESWLPIPPGNKTLYSNTGVNLAALVIARLSNMTFEQYVHEKILIPLGIAQNMGGYRLSNFNQNKKYLVSHYLYDSNFPPMFNELFVRLNATRLRNASEWLYLPFYGSSLYASGYLRMSARALGLFLQSFLNNFSTLLRNPSSLEEMLRIFPQENYANISNVKYSLIWNWVTLGKKRLVGHQGSLLGATNIMMANENRDLGVILLTNGDISSLNNATIAAGDTMNIILNQHFDCFEKKSSMACYEHPNITLISLIMCMLYLYLF